MDNKGDYMMEEDKIEEMINSLKGPLKELRKHQEQQLDMMKDNFDFIIKHKVNNEKIIERFFDELLDLVYFLGEDVEPLYNKLLDYYEKINEEAANDYKNFYLEIINEDDDIFDEEEIKK